MPKHRTTRSSRAAPARSSPTVLVAVTGLSPAVLTETIWALAHETPPTIPDQIVVLTTVAGRDCIAAKLFGSDQIWEQLRAALLGPHHAADPRLDFDQTPDRVKVFHRREGARHVPIAELATLADNNAIADALVDEFWLHTSKPDTRVIASLAGGYKTMSALCLSTMQLLANPGDRVTHVLVGGGFDHPQAGFFFPDQKLQTLAGPVGPLRARDAAKKIQIIDVPIIPLRRWFEDLLHIKPPSFDVLLSQGAAALQMMQTADLKLEVGPVVLPAGAKPKHFIRINEAPLALTPDQFAYIRFFAERRHAGEPAFDKARDAVDELAAWLKQVCQTEPRFYRMDESFDGTADKKPFDAAALSKRLLDLRKHLVNSGDAGRRLAGLLPGSGQWALQLPPDAITLRD